MITLCATREVSDLDGLIAASAAEGFLFVVRLRDEWVGGQNRFDVHGEVFLEARDEGRLVGVCGLNRDPYADDPSFGRLRHLYVLPSHRRRGIGRSMVADILRRARASFGLVRLRTDDADAAAFYERLGFRRVDPASGATHACSL